MYVLLRSLSQCTGHIRNGGQQMLRVIALWILKDLRRASGINEKPSLHYAYAIADVLHDSKIVRDQQNGQIKLMSKISEKIQNASLYAHIESAHRFISYQHIRFARQGARYAYALALSAGHLTRILLENGLT